MSFARVAALSLMLQAEQQVPSEQFKVLGWLVTCTSHMLAVLHFAVLLWHFLWMRFCLWSQSSQNLRLDLSIALPQLSCSEEIPPN